MRWVRGEALHVLTGQELQNVPRGSMGTEKRIPKGQPKKWSANGPAKHLWTHTSRSSMRKTAHLKSRFSFHLSLLFFTMITALRNHYLTHTLGRLFLEVPVTVCTFGLCALLDIKFTGTCYIMETGGRGWQHWGW